MENFNGDIIVGTKNLNCRSVVALCLAKSPKVMKRGDKLWRTTFAAEFGMKNLAENQLSLAINKMRAKHLQIRLDLQTLFFDCLKHLLVSFGNCMENRNQPTGLPG